MIISHRKKFAFFANQKTGSKAAGLMLRLSGIFDENDILARQPFLGTRSVLIQLPNYNIQSGEKHKVGHFTPEDAVKYGYMTLEQVREYDCYAFLRNPEKRFMASRSSMMHDRYGNPAMPGKSVEGPAPPQYKFFYIGDELVTTPLDFDDYDNELRRLIESLGGYHHNDYPRIVTTFRLFNTDGIVFDPTKHTKDIALYKKMKNGTL